MYLTSPNRPFMQKWLPIVIAFVSIKIGPTNLAFELTIQKNFYSHMS